MKTIEVTDEMHEFLMDLSKELNTQSHRCTRMPYFFQVRSLQEVNAVEGNGTKIWHDSDHRFNADDRDSIIETIAELKEWNEDEIDSSFEELDDCDIDEILKDHGYCEYWVEDNHKYEESFLTDKACKQHIKSNGHHYREPVNYLTGSFRNPEMETLMTFLCELSGGKLHT